MSLAYPVQVLAIEPGDSAVVEMRGRCQRVALFALADPMVMPGDWLLVQSGVALVRIDADEAITRDKLLDTATAQYRRRSDQLVPDSDVPSDLEPGHIQSGHIQSGDAQPGHIQSVDARSVDARPGDVRPGDVRPGDARGIGERGIGDGAASQVSGTGRSW